VLVEPHHIGTGPATTAERRVAVEIATPTMHEPSYDDDDRDKSADFNIVEGSSTLMVYSMTVFGR
jgi:hypothetical protein